MCGGSPLGRQAVSRSSCSVQGQTWHAHRRLEAGFGSVAFQWEVCAFRVRCSGWEWSSVGLNRPPHLFYCPLALELWTQSRRLSGDVAAAPYRSTALSPAFLRPCTHTFASCRRAHIRVTHSASIHCALGAAPGPALAEPPPSRGRKDAEH